MIRRPLALFAALAIVGFVIASGGAARAGVVPPSAYPSGVGVATSAYTLQFAGANREGTAAGIALDGATSTDATGGYPYQAATPDADPGLAKTYGPAVCPKTLVLAADDTPADALSAAGLLGQSALKVTDSGGSPATFNTASAALLLTPSGRESATQLDPTTTLAIAKIKAACTGTIDGIVLGGVSAIPDSVLSEFKESLADVARIAGADRDDTAREIALAIASAAGGLPTVRYYPSATSPGTAGATNMPKTVFLAEDQTGADALAVGPVAARFGVPVLLTTTNSLPVPTQNALAALTPKNIVILGGSSAVADAVATAASAAAGGATVTRIAGPDRYATSFEIAEQLFNLYPNYATALGAGAYSDQMFGLARDEGSAATGNHVGWPDALASAYYLASLDNGASAPARMAPAVEQSRADDGQTMPSVTSLSPVACGSSGSKCIPDVPLLLTTGSALAPEVNFYLEAMYPPSGSYKTAAHASGSNDGGFGFVFGGIAAVSAATTGQMATDLSGQTYNPSTASDLNPSVNAAAVFYTTDSLTPFTVRVPGTTTATFVGAGASGVTPGAPRICAMPGALAGDAGVSAFNDQGSFAATNPVDYYGGTTPYPAQEALGSCVDLSTTALGSKTDTATFYGVSLSGNASAPVAVTFAPTATLSTTAITTPPTGGTNTGTIFTPIPSGTSETDTITYTGIVLGPTTYKGTSVSGATASLSLVLTRTKAANNSDVISWTGQMVVFSGTAAVFSAAVKQGLADVTPLTAAPLVGPINLLGEYSAPGLGAMELTLTPSAVPAIVPTAGAIQVSGGA